MADARPFAVYDSAGAPVTGAAGGMSALAWDVAGTPRTPPAVTELGGGLYQVAVTDADETAGTLVLVTTGYEPARITLACYEGDRSNQFFGWHLEDSAGALWVGAAPTFGAWDDSAGAPRTPPAVVTVSAGVYVAVPSAGDVTADSAGRIDAPAGAAPAYLAAATQPVAAGDNPWTAPSSGPLLNPAADVVAFLDTKAAGAVTLTDGTTLFRGQMRSRPGASSPAVFCLNTGGPGPDPYLGGHRKALFRPTVQVLMRGPAGDLEAGETMARAVFAWLHQRVVAGYVSWYARDSQPVLIAPEDNAQHGVWVINLECQYVSALDS